MKSIVKDGVLYFEFSDEFDNMQIYQIKPLVVQLIEKNHCPIVKFDFKEVTFIDSTGIGFVLALYNQIQAYGGELILKNVNSMVRKVFALSGIFSIIKVENRERKGVH